MAREPYDTPGDAAPRPHANCYWLWPGRVLAGEYPAGHIAEIEAAGITHFIDLTVTPETPRGYTPLTAQHLAHGITDFGIPTAQGMRRTLDAIAAALDGGGAVYLHCRAGIGRTGTVAACWLVEQGFAPEEALALLQRKFRAMAKSAFVGRTPETEAQRAFVLSWRTAPGGPGAARA